VASAARPEAAEVEPQAAAWALLAVVVVVVVL